MHARNSAGQQSNKKKDCEQDKSGTGPICQSRIGYKYIYIVFKKENSTNSDTKKNPLSHVWFLILNQTRFETYLIRKDTSFLLNSLQALIRNPVFQDKSY